jgi:hypothetical protein
MSSNLRSETARINGAKSRGPVSAEGLAKSSRNALKHGLTSISMIILDTEDPDEFDRLLNDFFARYQPAGPAEQDLVEEMVAARWRSLLNSEILAQLAKIVTTDAGIQLAFAFRSLSDDSHALSLVSRYESRLQRTYDRAYRLLRDLQQSRPPVQPTDSEPSPAPDPAPTENCETNPGPVESTNGDIKICNDDPVLHFPKSCLRLKGSDVERKSSSISAPRRRPTPSPCRKQYYYFGHRIRPRVRPLGRVSEATSGE